MSCHLVDLLVGVIYSFELNFNIHLMSRDEQGLTFSYDGFCRSRFIWLCLELYLFIPCRAVKSGACGVPSFMVDDGPLIWGQDRLNVIQDMMCGWTQSDHTPSSRL